MDEEIAIRIDLKTAQALVDVIYMFGEHVAAGVPIEVRDDDTELGELVGDFYKNLRKRIREAK
ncbi:hypothetical protein [Kitasatospora kifunensis]|uniref:Uncharacterized protein n=1 Tax=Kitasatospora kifunensis TaxID=58351 RepID=A0A7W7VWR3_KITKI|nr:hypothetical protein [Kitasatospora kifunensis]MBB4925782.1 hypothetical protein [Kitasatospora kifunensis]